VTVIGHFKVLGSLL